MTSQPEILEKLSVFVDLLLHTEDKTISSEVNGRVVFRATLKGKDKDTVWIDFMDEYDWMKDSGEMWTVVKPDERLIAYRVCLSPTDKNYTQKEKPYVMIKSGTSSTVDLDDVDFDEGGRVLEPDSTSSLGRHDYVKKERDLSSAISFITKIFEENSKNTTLKQEESVG